MIRKNEPQSLKKLTVPQKKVVASEMHSTSLQETTAYLRYRVVSSSNIKAYQPKRFTVSRIISK